MGTGIVFVVLVAIWVAYFVQYWSRRREHLATARSVEAFSEAMRVLERRPVLRAPSGDRISTAYAVSPARVVGARAAPRPQVVAKPHAPTQPPPSRGGVPRMSSPQPSRAQRRATRPGPAGAGRPSRSRPLSTAPGRRIRGLILLGSIIATIVLVGLAAFSILLPWVPLVGAATVVGSFLWLRAGVRAEQEARRARRARARQRQTVRRSPASNRTAELVAAGASEAPVRTGATPGSGEVDDLADAELIERIEVTAESQARPDGWQPVPVPPPTYTLKARAERPAVAATVDQSQAAQAAVADAEATRGSDSEPVDEPTTPATGNPAHGEGHEHRSAAYGT